MPCACKTPIETYPDNADWGPLFWTLLHGFAEKAGGFSAYPTLMTDELRLWEQLLTQLQHCLPCDKCRDHYKEWLQLNPIQPYMKEPYSMLKPILRSWLWNLHNMVNERNGKAVFPREAIETTYKSVDLTRVWKQLDPVMKKAIQLNGVTQSAWKKWLMTLRTLQGMYGV